MSSLYNITGEYLELKAMLEDQELDQEVVKDTLAAVQGELEIKAHGYVQVIKELDAKAKAMKEEADFFAKKQKHLENNVKALKNALCNAMIITGHDDKKGLEAGNYTLKVQNNGGKQPLVIDGDVPESFCKVIIEPDTEKIRAFLEGLDGEDSCEWAHLEERGKHLVIR